MAEKSLWDEARSCPRCHHYGRAASQRPGNRPGSTVHMFECETIGCRWFGTQWAVQVNADGSIPVRDSNNTDSKAFPALTDWQKVQAQAELDNLKRETNPNG